MYYINATQLNYKDAKVISRCLRVQKWLLLTRLRGFNIYVTILALNQHLQDECNAFFVTNNECVNLNDKISITMKDMGESYRNVLENSCKFCHTFNLWIFCNEAPSTSRYTLKMFLERGSAGAQHWLQICLQCTLRKLVVEKN